MKKNDINCYERFLFFGGGVMAERLYNQIDCAEKKLMGVFDLFDDGKRAVSSFKNHRIKNVREYSKELNNVNVAIVVAIGHFAVFKIVNNLLKAYPYISDRLFVANPYSSLRFFMVDDELAAEERVPFTDEKYTKVRNLLNDKESLTHFDLLIKSKPYESVSDSYELIPYESIKDMYYYTEDYWNTYSFSQVVNDNCATVIDCGAYIGDSVVSIVNAMPQKNVDYYALEPLAENVEKMKANCEFNTICKSFNVLEFGVGAENKKLYFHIPANNDKEGGRFTDDPQGAIDSLDIRKIDDIPFQVNGPLYIKMDIEGSELLALKGALNTIIKFHPYLAICLYHRKNDLVDIPLYIDSLGINYKFYLRGGYHTILWAIPE